jgi:hypothetical protein
VEWRFETVVMRFPLMFQAFISWYVLSSKAMLRPRCCRLRWLRRWRGWQLTPSAQWAQRISVAWRRLAPQPVVAQVFTPTYHQRCRRWWGTKFSMDYTMSPAGVK